MTLLEFMKDPDRLEKLKDLVATGASISTVEAILGLRKGRLKEWLEVGASASKPKNAQEKRCRRLHTIFRESAGEARYIAESAMLAKRPTEWLDKNTSSRIVDPIENTPPSQGLIGGPSETPQVPANMISTDSLKLALHSLVEAGLLVQPTAPKTVDSPNVTSVD